ncbi:hypothetical protein DIPPA_06247 [Diplonema papillatum]|nr:hypothetical protein DIPPA_06247 [Diplonema papillatum]
MAGLAAEAEEALLRYLTANGPSKRRQIRAGLKDVLAGAPAALLNDLLASTCAESGGVYSWLPAGRPAASAAPPAPQRPEPEGGAAAAIPAVGVPGQGGVWHAASVPWTTDYLPPVTEPTGSALCEWPLEAGGGGQVGGGAGLPPETVPSGGEEYDPVASRISGSYDPEALAGPVDTSWLPLEPHSDEFFAALRRVSRVAVPSPAEASLGPGYCVSSVEGYLSAVELYARLKSVHAVAVHLQHASALPTLDSTPLFVIPFLEAIRDLKAEAERVMAVLAANINAFTAMVRSRQGPQE